MNYCRIDKTTGKITKVFKKNEPITTANGGLISRELADRFSDSRLLNFSVSRIKKNNTILNFSKDFQKIVQKFPKIGELPKYKYEIVNIPIEQQLIRLNKLHSQHIEKVVNVTNQRKYTAKYSILNGRSSLTEKEKQEKIFLEKLFEWIEVVNSEFIQYEQKLKNGEIPVVTFTKFK